LWVIERLRQGGHLALLAGGCVRDMLLGRQCSDYDVATSAAPDEVAALFGRVLMIGAKFGVAMVLHDNRQIEVATFRSDTSYSDGRRPDSVSFTTAREDAERRDFTINGMFYDPIAEEVIDYVGGREDIKQKVIRTIGSPDLRFSEDYLRMMRAVRFAVRLDFEIDDATALAIEKHAERITTISGERICDELSKMLSQDSAAAALETLHRVGLARRVIGELFEEPGRWERAVQRVGAVSAGRETTLSLSALLCELSPRAISKIVRRWGSSNELKNALCRASRNLGRWQDAGEAPLCDFKRLMSGGRFDHLLELWRFEERLANSSDELCRRIAARAESIPSDRVSPKPLVTGDDLIAMGLREGPALGRIASAIYEAQLNEEFDTPDQARRAAEKLIAEDQ